MNKPPVESVPQKNRTGFDLEFARFLARISGDSSPELLFSAALASNARGRGNICVDLARDVGKDDAEFDEARLKASLAMSPAVGRPGDYRPLILDGSRLYLYRYWEFENNLSADLKLRSSISARPDPDSLRERIARLFPRGSEGQKQAAVIAALKNFAVISGGPGTGKTSTVARVIALLNELAGPGKTLRSALAAPTGKAAARLQESMRSEIEAIDCAAAIRSVLPFEASTVHRLLGWRPGGFRYNSNNRLELDVLVVDEASMVDLALLSRLVQALPDNCRLILLGDRDQLASVEAGAVLGDICGRAAREYSPDLLWYFAKVIGGGKMRGAMKEASGPAIRDCIAVLNESFRFGPESPIGNLSRAVNAGSVKEAIEACEAVSGAEWVDLPDFRKIAAELRGPVLESFGPVLKSDGPAEALQKMNAFRVLCAVREGFFGVRSINERVKEILRVEGLLTHEARLYKGCPVMVTSNNYSLNLYNGDIGIIWPDPDNRGQLRAFFNSAEGMRSLPLFSLPEHEVVYAMTVHKSQGSEFDRVLFILPDHDTPLLTRELIYTAVTRAREQVVIWGKKEVLAAAVSRRIERSSGLREALWGN